MIGLRSFLAGLPAVLAVLLCCGPADAVAGGTVSVRGYYRKDGTYVRPHTRSAPGSGSSSTGSYSTGGSFVPPPTVPRLDSRTAPRTAYRSVYATDSERSPAESQAEIDRRVAAGVQAELDRRKALEARSESDRRAAAEAQLELDERKAQSKLKIAKQFLKAGDTAHAIEFLDRILADFPRTATADEAREMLSILRK